MKKVIFFSALAILLLAMYLMRVDLIQKLVPIVASGYGVNIDTLQINQLDIDKIAIEKISFNYQLDGTEILFDITDASVNLMMAFDALQNISNVLVDHMTIDIRVKRDKAVQSHNGASTQTLKAYIEQLPLYKIDVAYLEINYFENDALLARYNGELVYASGLKLSGKLSYQDISASIDLSVDDTKASLLISDNEGSEAVNLQGNYVVKDDWLILDAHAHYSLKAIDDFFAADERGEFLIHNLEGELGFDGELDFLQTLDKALETFAIKANLESSIKFSSDNYKIKDGLADVRAQCIYSSMAIKSCSINQPQNFMVNFSEAPKQLQEYFNKKIDTYYFEVNPNDLLELRNNVAKDDDLTIVGAAKLFVYPESSELNLSIDLSNIELQANKEKWLLFSDYDLAFNAKSLAYPFEAQDLKLTIKGRLKADPQQLILNTRKGSTLALRNVSYQEASMNVLYFQKQSNSEVNYNFEKDRFRVGEHQISMIPKGVIYNGVTFIADAVALDIQQYQITQDEHSLNAELSMGVFEARDKGLNIKSADWMAKVNIDANKLTVEGDLLLGTKNTPLEFIISDDMDMGTGHVQFESLAIPLANNEVIKQVIGMTGFPLQLKSGGVALSGGLNWDNEYQNTRMVVNLSAKNVDGDYAQNPFVNLNVDMNLEENSGWVLSTPSTLTIDEVNMGVPLRDVTMRLEEYQYGVQSQPAVRVEDLYAAALEGSIYSNVIDIDLNKPVNQFSIYLSELSLEKLVELNQTQDLLATGIVNGELPMSLNDGVLKIDNGWMKADERGGFIKYGRVSDVLSGNKDLKLVAQLLEDFQYHEMSAVVNLSPDGALNLNTKLHGNSPEADFDAPVNLNFNIDLNLWKFLESARLLTRIGEDITEQVALPGGKADK